MKTRQLILSLLFLFIVMPIQSMHFDNSTKKVTSYFLGAASTCLGILSLGYQLL